MQSLWSEVWSSSGHHQRERCARCLCLKVARSSAHLCDLAFDGASTVACFQELHVAKKSPKAIMVCRAWGSGCPV